jgi:predicted nucleic acid-binding Zn ribbon protein
MIDHSRKCVVCGAAVKNMNPKCNTCDSICTRAKNNNITRNEQVIRDIQQEEAEERELWRN